MGLHGAFPERWAGGFLSSGACHLKTTEDPWQDLGWASEEAFKWRMLDSPNEDPQAPQVTGGWISHGGWPILVKTCDSRLVLVTLMQYECHQNGPMCASFRRPLSYHRRFFKNGVSSARVRPTCWTPHGPGSNDTLSLTVFPLQTQWFSGSNSEFSVGYQF